jgi:Rod binding domain-containing protein
MEGALANALTSLAKPAGPASLKGVSKSNLEAEARTAAKEFEAVFLTTMLEGMFEGLKTDGPFGGGSAEKTYRSLLVTEYAKQMSQNGGLGLSDQITRDLIALQEGAQK